MRHFIQLHLTAQMGPPVLNHGNEFEVFSNNADLIREASAAGIMWLLVVDGNPKRYGIAWRFLIQGITPCIRPGFSYSVVGVEGRVFSPPIWLDESPLAAVRACVNELSPGLSELDDAATQAIEQAANQP